MSSFRVIVYAPGEACVIGFSDVTDFVSAAHSARLLRERGHLAKPLVNTRSVHRQAEEWIATNAVGIAQIKCCQCGSVAVIEVTPPKGEEDCCDGK